MRPGTWKHGESKYKDRPITPEYRAWGDMRQRCLNPNTRHFADYGGRGIGVCERWNIYENFLADMGRRPTLGHELERIDNDKGYSPENCRWATRTEQCRNQRRTVFLEYDGRRLSLSAWVEELGLSKATIMGRLLRGWTVERALTEPTQTQFHKGFYERAVPDPMQ